MKLEVTLSKNELLSKLKTVSRAIKIPNKVIKAHESFMFEINDEFIVTGADESGNISAVVDCEFKKPAEPVSCLVDSRTIMDGLKELPEQPIQLQFHAAGRGYAIVLLYGSGKYNLSGIDSDGFSLVKNNESSSNMVNLSSSDLLKGIKAVYPFAGVDELRPIMSSVYISCKSGEFTFCATNSSTMGMLNFEYDGEDPIDFQLVLPIKLAKILIDILPKESDLRMGINSKNVTIQFDGFTLVYRLAEGQYPNFRSVIPVNNDKVLLANTSNLISSLRRVSIFANKASSMIQITPMERNLTIIGRDIDIQQSAEENIPVDYTGDELTIGFSSQLLMKCLEAIETEDVKMTFSDARRAVLLIPDEENAGLTVLIMPIMINV